jgi:hypothetical protein
MADQTSIDLLIEISRSERDAQLSHFDSLDTKAGLALGFAGVLIALGNGSGSVIGLTAVVLAALSAVAAVSSFWPRQFPSIDPTRLGDYALSERVFTQLTVLDTLEVMMIQTSQMLEVKSRRLKWALVSLTVGAVMAAVDLLTSV